MSARRLVVASGNAAKARELRELLAPSGWAVLSPREAALPAVGVVESGRSYLENATLKAVAYAHAAGLPALADDSGLEVDALQGGPGVLSARYGGLQLADRRRYERLLRELAGVPAVRRGARFRAVLALALPGGRVIAREGTLEGRIALTPRGADGFGYDPVFELPDGRTLAEAGAEKQRISHRAIASRAMIEVLRTLDA
ncbi:MAG: non-canonical purine NTP pyrophosphatase [Dehalococcoidia bacterium]|nr:non-canonical purine NTP pyrophosphatase [Dehalococcoidia bacterium]